MSSAESSFFEVEDPIDCTTRMQRSRLPTIADDFPNKKGLRRSVRSVESGAETELNLDGADLSELPSSVGLLTSLTSLSASNNSLYCVPPSIDGLVNLQALYLNQNRVVTLPKNFGEQLFNLRFLWLEGNRLSSLPDSVGKLTSLRGLYVGDNALAALPWSIGKLSNLVTLSASRNQLTWLPSSVKELTNLRALIVTGNKMCKLPDSIAKLSHLAELWASENKLTELPRSLPLSLRELWLDQNDLLTLPESIGDLAHLRVLNLAFNSLVSVPQSLSKLAELYDLRLDGNAPLLSTPMGQQCLSPPGTTWAADLSAWFEAESALDALVFTKDWPQSCWEEVGKVERKESTVLDLTGRGLEILPDSIGKLINLTEIFVDHNALTALPETIGDLAHLRVLIANDNSIVTVPSSLARLRNLRVLHLHCQGPHLTAVPEILFRNLPDELECVSGNATFFSTHALSILTHEMQQWWTGTEF